MKNFIAGYFAGGITLLCVWVIYQHRKQIETGVQSVMNKADQAFKKVESIPNMMNNCNCGCQNDQTQNNANDSCNCNCDSTSNSNTNND